MEIKIILSEASEAVKRAKSITLNSEVEIAALRWELYASLQNILDAASMIIADLGLRKPRFYGEIGEAFYEAKLLDEEAKDALSIVAATRNMLAHAYRKIAAEDLQRIKSEVLPKAEETIKELLKLIESKHVDPGDSLNSAANFESPKALEALAQVFKKHDVQTAYLFGSRARGTAREDSDYDIAVLLSKDKPTIMDEIALTMELAKALGEPVDKINVISLNNVDAVIEARVLREGFPIYSSNEQFRRKWERKTLLKILGNTDLNAIYAKRALKT